METVSDFDVLLDDLISEKDDLEEHRVAARQEQKVREVAMFTTGAQIRDNALNRRKRDSDNGGGDAEYYRNDSTPRAKRVREGSVIDYVSACMIYNANRWVYVDETILLEEEAP